MKSMLVCALATISMHATAQDLALENTRTKGSNRLYIGVDNTLLVKGNVKQIRSVRSDKAAVKMNNDTLIIKPGHTGSLTITIETKKGAKNFAYTTAYLPPFNLDLPNEVTKEALLTGTVFKVKIDEPDKLYRNYEVVEYELVVGENDIRVAPNAVAEEARKAIERIASGTTVVLKRSLFINRENGRQIENKTTKLLKVL